MTELKVGQSLTYEQAMALPDGAVVSAVWGDDAKRTRFTAGGKHSRRFGGVTLENVSYWDADFWHSVRLESLPEPAKPERRLDELQCGKCGTTFACDVVHECAKRQASEIEKRAALALLETLAYKVRDATGGDLDYIDAFNRLESECRKFVESYDYAKTLGALND